MKPTLSAYVGIFLVSAATLLVQVTFTRIFSASIWYHFAFLVVSVSLFGFGASGVALAFLRSGEHDRLRTAAGPALFGLAVMAAYFGTNAIPFSPFRILDQPVQVAYFALYDLLLTLPFFFAGATVALLLRTYPEHAGRLYAADLVGAAVGSVLVFIALPKLGAPGAVWLGSAIGFGSAVALAPTARLRGAAVVALAMHLPLLLSPWRLPEVRIDSSKPIVKEITEKGGHLAFTGWNALSRIDVIEGSNRFPSLVIDSAAETVLSPKPEGFRFRSDVSTLGVAMRKQPAVLIIGPGGGMDVHHALALGASAVTAVEINPLIIELVTGRYREAVDDVFSDPRVRLVQDEGRSYIQRTEERPDVIQLTLIDTWAASVSGAFSLTENYLYTTEAVRTYLEHLAPDGMLSITRWYYEVPRLASLGRAALESMGVDGARERILIVQQGIRVHFLMKREPFRDEEMAFVRRLAEQFGWRIQHDPLATEAQGFFGRFLSAVDPGEMFAESDSALDPVSDDDPFFFQMTRWKGLSLSGLKDFDDDSFLRPLAVPVAQITLLVALGLGVLLSAALLVVPIASGVLPREGRRGWLGYFLALGFAYITVEVVLMQRFALFLGHPTYSITTVLFSILLFSGVGSFWSSARRGTPGAVLRPILFLLPVGILLLCFAVPPLTRALIGLPHAARLALAIGFIAPVAFLMGVPFPVGIRAVNASEPAHIPWAWAANGCASVIGSVCAVLGAMAWNFTTMLLVAGVVYVAALAGISRSRVEIS